MLIYLGTGPRRYGLTPILPVRRRGWEFQAVVSGSIGMLITGEEKRLSQRTLWLSPPGHLHGWTGQRKPAEVTVFQFPSVPEPLRRLFDDDTAMEVGLTEADCNRLRELAERASVYWKCPSPGMVMCYEHVLLELSLLIYEARRGQRADEETNIDRRRVGDALRWYAERVEQNPALSEVAGAVNVSPSHLRRLFYGVLQAGPKQAFDQLRFQRAIQLMADSKVKLSAVSGACGFESQSSFSRAFKAKFGCAPDVWRE